MRANLTTKARLDKGASMSGHTPWRDIKHKAQKPAVTQRSRNGLEIPAPKRDDLMAAFRKIIQPAKRG